SWCTTSTTSTKHPLRFEGSSHKRDRGLAHKYPGLQQGAYAPPFATLSRDWRCGYAGGRARHRPPSRLSSAAALAVFDWWKLTSQRAPDYSRLEWSPRQGFGLEQPPHSAARR